MMTTIMMTMAGAITLSIMADQLVALFGCLGIIIMLGSTTSGSGRIFYIGALFEFVACGVAAYAIFVGIFG